MIEHEIKLRPRYGEVDRMGYVYHANYVAYCHQARTELLRTLGICDDYLESRNIMLPVLSIALKYLKPAKYDEELAIKTVMRLSGGPRLFFEFEVINERSERVCTADSAIAFVAADTRKPVRMPEFVTTAVEEYFEKTGLLE